MSAEGGETSYVGFIRVEFIRLNSGWGVAVVLFVLLKDVLTGVVDFLDAEVFVAQ